MLSQVRTHPRLFVSAAIGILVGLLLPEGWGQIARALAGWDIAATLYMAMVAFMMTRSTTQAIREKAALQDESGWTILAMSAGVATAGLCAVIGLFSGFKELPPSVQPYHLALSLYTILCSWFFLHTIFAVHYAHEFYGAHESEPGHHKSRRGGLQFPGTDTTPGYDDFLYFSFVIGMTAQTSDTAVTNSRMRRLALAHGILAFAFNTVILALSINIAASLL